MPGTLWVGIRFRETTALDFHGVRVDVINDDAECAATLASDFSRFLVPADRVAPPPVITVLASFSSPPQSCLPRGRRPWVRTRDADVYAWQGKRVLDSRGEVLVTLQFNPERAQIYSLNRSLIREKSYLVIMSRVGAWLDRHGLHRIHAMGVSRAGRAVVCALPEGGGKTTLTLGLMSLPGFALLSDEVPLVSRRGRVLGMPIRLGVRKDASLAIPAQFLSDFRRARHEPKTLIDAGWFGERISTRAEPGILLIGRRTDAETPRIDPAGFLVAFSALWRLCVRGEGVPQLLEYVLRIRPGALLSQLSILASRTLACIALIRRSECYTLLLGRNCEANAQIVARLAGEAGPAKETLPCSRSR